MEIEIFQTHTNTMETFSCSSTATCQSEPRNTKTPWSKSHQAVLSMLPDSISLNLFIIDLSSQIDKLSKKQKHRILIFQLTENRRPTVPDRHPQIDPKTNCQSSLPALGNSKDNTSTESEKGREGDEGKILLMLKIHSRNQKTVRSNSSETPSQTALPWLWQASPLCITAGFPPKLKA